jgi:serine/threonine protein kinase
MSVKNIDISEISNDIEECDCCSDDEISEIDSSDCINTDSDIISSHNCVIDRSYIESDVEMDICEDIFITTTIVNEKYINEPHIILSDFGNYIYIDDLNGHGDIQTRHYRSPEIILRMDLSEKIDIWALGCTIYELYTGKILFNPHKSLTETTDMVHLYEMQCALGLFPKKFYNSRKKYVFFKDDCLLHNMKKLNYVGVDEKIKKDLCDTEKYNHKIIELIKIMLNYDCDERLSADTLLNIIK